MREGWIILREEYCKPPKFIAVANCPKTNLYYTAFCYFYETVEDARAKDERIIGVFHIKYKK